MLQMFVIFRKKDSLFFMGSSYLILKERSLFYLNGYWSFIKKGFPFLGRLLWLKTMMRTTWLSVFWVIIFVSFSGWSKQPHHLARRSLQKSIRLSSNKSKKKSSHKKWARRSRHPECSLYFSQANQENSFSQSNGEVLLTPIEPSEEELRDFQKVGWDLKEGVGYMKNTAFPITLVKLEPYGGYFLEIRTAKAFLKMASIAKKKGVHLMLKSGFREMEKQKELFNEYCFHGKALAAVPGTSLHQAGYAIDLDVKTRGVKTWLQKHATEFGFCKTVPTEAWHYEYGDALLRGVCGFTGKRSRQKANLMVAKNHKPGRNRFSHKERKPRRIASVFMNHSVLDKKS